jgi:hypothetical protein
MVRNAPDNAVNAIIGLASKLDEPGNLYVPNAADGIELRNFKTADSGMFVTDDAEWQSEIVAQVSDARVGTYGDLWLNGGEYDRVSSSLLQALDTQHSHVFWFT